MRLSANYNIQSETHGRNGGRLKAGTYVVRIDSVLEDQTGYGNQSLKLVYNIVEGEFAGFFDDITGDASSDWRHTIEVDVEENNGGRLNSLINAVAASNPGFPALQQWVEGGANELMLIGKVVGVTFQERLITNKRGKRKGQTSSYLDLWDFLPVDRVRMGQYDIPPVNDQRDPSSAMAAEQSQVPVTVPSAMAQGIAQQAPMVGAAPNAAPSAPVVPSPQAAVAAPMAPQVPMAGYQQQAYAPQPQVAGVPQQDVYSEDIPF